MDYVCQIDVVQQHVPSSVFGLNNMYTVYQETMGADLWDFFVITHYNICLTTLATQLFPHNSLQLWQLLNFDNPNCLSSNCAKWVPFVQVIVSNMTTYIMGVWLLSWKIWQWKIETAQYSIVEEHKYNTIQYIVEQSTLQYEGCLSKWNFSSCDFFLN